MKGAPNFAKAFMDVLKKCNKRHPKRSYLEGLLYIVEEILFMKVALSFCFCSFLSSCAICIKLGSGKVARSHALHCHTAGLLLFFSFAVQHLLEHLSWQRLQGNRVSKVGLGKRLCARLEITFPEFFAVWKVPKSSNRGNDKFGNFATFNFPFARLQRLQRLLPNFEENNLNNSFLIYWLLQPLS